MDFPGESRYVTSTTIQTAQVMAGIGDHLIGNAAGAPISRAWPAANRALYIPFIVGVTFVAVQMFVVNGATVSGNIDVGIYDGSGNRLVSKGSTAQAGVSSQQAFDITDTVLLPGRYYMGVAMDNATGTLIAWGPVAGLAGSMGCLQQATAFALPATATFAAMASAFIPGVGIHSRTTI